jgi:hypothetical protein
MDIDFEIEKEEIISNLKQVKGYYECDKIILQHICNQILKGHIENEIHKYLNQLIFFFSKFIVTNQDHTNCTNYRYTVAFLDAIIKYPNWYKWISSTHL